MFGKGRSYTIMTDTKKSSRTSLWYANQMLKSGISVIPVGLNKLPYGKWKQYQQQLPTSSELEALFSPLPDDCAIATIGGAVSSGLNIIDFDTHDDFELLENQVAQLIQTKKPNLFKSLMRNTTPSGGSHWRYKVLGEVEGNSVLAKYPTGETAIETRGEGGYAITPPSKGYEVTQGSIVDLVSLSPEEHNWLLAQIRSFDQSPVQPKVGDYKKDFGNQDQNRAGDKYNQTDEYKNLLIKHGWSVIRSDAEREYWRRPNKNDQGWSATFHLHNRVFCCHSTNAHPIRAYNGEGDGYTPFELLTVLEHAGDFTDAARGLFGLNPDWGTPKTKVSSNQPAESTNHEFIEAEGEGRVVHEVISEDESVFDKDILVPSGSWLDSYYSFMHESTDAPCQYIAASGLGIMSYALRHLKMAFGINTLRPNLWIVLVGKSTSFRKTTTMTATRKLIQQNHTGSGLPESVTPEALINHMADEDEDLNEGIFFWSELGQVLKNYDKSYMQGMKELLTNLYDCPDFYEHRTQGGGLKTIDSPFVNVFACSTERWLNDSLKSGDLHGGFLPRFLWVQAKSKNRHYTVPRKWNTAWRNQLMDEMNQYNNITRGVEIDLVENSEAFQLFDNFSINSDREVEKHAEAEMLSAFYGRLTVYCLKLAMLFQVIEAQAGDRVDPQLSASSMQTAINWCEFFKGSIKQIVDDFAFDDEASDRQTVLKAIRKHPAITRSKLIKVTKMSSRKLDHALETLFQSEQVILRQEKAKPTDRKLTSFYHILLPPKFTL